MKITKSYFSKYRERRGAKHIGDKCSIFLIPSEEPKVIVGHEIFVLFFPKSKFERMYSSLPSSNTRVTQISQKLTAVKKIFGIGAIIKE